MKLTSLAAVLLSLATIQPTMAGRPTEEEVIDVTHAVAAFRQSAEQWLWQSIKYQQMHRYRGPCSNLAYEYSWDAWDNFQAACLSFAGTIDMAHIGLFNEAAMAQMFQKIRVHLKDADAYAYQAWLCACHAANHEHHDGAAPAIAYNAFIGVRYCSIYMNILMGFLEENPELVHIVWWELDLEAFAGW